MTETPTGDHNPGQYEIRLKGHMAPRWAAWFDGLSLAQKSDGTPSSLALSPTRQHSMACSRECATSACH